jgi:hypothetical protein
MKGHDQTIPHGPAAARQAAGPAFGRKGFHRTTLHGIAEFTRGAPTPGAFQERLEKCRPIWQGL